jgi:hypothetical protein
LHKSIQNSNELINSKGRENDKNEGIIMCSLVQIFNVYKLIILCPLLNKQRDLNRYIIVIPDTVYDNEKENWRILTYTEIYAIVKKPTITETIRLHRLRWFEHVQRMGENRIPQRVLYRNMELTRPNARPRNRW